MRNHQFKFPEDVPENYNPDGQTLTGRCKCGATQEARGMRWAIPAHDKFLQYFPYRETQLEGQEILDKVNAIC